MIQYIDSKFIDGCKIVLWRTGNYRYQIEVRNGDASVSSRNINAEFYDALDQFEEFTENFVAGWDHVTV